MNCPSGEIFSPLISTSPKNIFLSMIGGCSARTVSGTTRTASVDAKRTSLFIFRSRTTTAILIIPPSCLTLYAEPRILYLLNVVGRTLTHEDPGQPKREHELRRSESVLLPQSLIFPVGQKCRFDH